MTSQAVFTGHSAIAPPGIRPPRQGRTGPNDVARRLAARVRQASEGLDDIVVWRSRDNRLRRAAIGPQCYELGMERSYPIRLEYRWPQRRAYSNERWCSHTGESLHCESMTERLGIMQLEYFFNAPGLPRIAAAATQPMLVITGRKHRFPDLMLRLTDGRRLVIDIKRRNAMTEAVKEKLAVTREVCQRVGWQYAVVHEPAKVVEYNLEMLSSRRHPRFAPWPELREAVLAQCRSPRPLGEVVDAISPRGRGLIMPYVHHLLWARAMDPLTLHDPLDWDTPVAATGHERTS